MHTTALPWWSRGWDSVLPMQWEWVQPLVRELRFYIPCSEAKKEIKYEKKINNIFLKAYYTREGRCGGHGRSG